MDRVLCGAHFRFPSCWSARSRPLHRKATKSLDEFVKRAEAASIAQRKSALYTEIAERQLESADKLYTNGQVDRAAGSAVDDVVTYSDRASDATQASADSGNRMKPTEIAIAQDGREAA